MLADRFFAPVLFTVEGDSCRIILAWKRLSHRLIFVDSNLTTSLKRNESNVSLTISMKKGERGLLAYVIETGDYGCEFLTEVSFTEGKPRVHLDETFFAHLPDRFGEVVHMGGVDGYCLRVNAHVGNTLREYINQRDAKGTKVVMTPGLLCSFLMGDFIKTDVLDFAATEHAAEESAREQLAKLQKEIERKDREYWEDTKAQQEEINRLKEDLARSNDIDETNRMQRNAFKDALAAARTLLRCYQDWKFWDRPDRKIWKKILKEKLEVLKRS